MKKLLFILLFPLTGYAQISDADLNLEADIIRTETHGGRNTAERIGRMFKDIIANKPNLTVTPILTAGTNISITGTLPNLTINQVGGSGISNSAPSGDLMKSNGTNAVGSGVTVPGSGQIVSTVSPGSISLTTTGNVCGTSSTDILVKRSGSSSLVVGLNNNIELLNTTSGKAIMLQGSDDVTQFFKYDGSTWTEALRLTSTGSLSWTNFTTINGWTATTTHKFRVTPQGYLEISMRLNGSSASATTFASLTGLTLPVSSGTLLFLASTGGGTAVIVTATITSSSTISLDYTTFPTTSLTITGSVPIDSAF